MDGPSAVRRVVLVVEPDPVIGALLSDAVSAEPEYQAVLTTDAAVALATAESVQIDIAIIDLDLPGMSGIELVDRLLTVTSAKLPVLVVSDGSTAHTDLMRERRIGTYVQKPFDVDTLIRLVRKLAPPAPIESA